MLTVGRRTGGAGLEPGCVRGAGVSQWSPKILPAPSCFVFTMVLVDRGYVDMGWGRVVTRVYCRPIDGNIRFI